MTLKPIGIFESDQIEPYQAGRQPDSMGLPGKIRLNKGENYEQALQDLEGCSHIWIIFGFHLNGNWKPLSQTPRSDKKIGVFATRSPYRPNPIGLSLVKLISVDGLVINVGENDILNDSPIYDIKPYHPEYDHVDDAKIEWLENSIVEKNTISFSPYADGQLDFLEHNGVKEMRTFIQRQLEYDPTNSDKKRVAQNGHIWTLSYRTWRVDFSFHDNIVGVLSINTGYSEDDLKNFEDQYKDKAVHRLFKKEFN